MLFRMLYDDKLAQAAYLIGCQRTGEAIVIDPERDVDRYIEAAAAEGLRITAIAETHIHADFLSGARELAEQTGATLYLSDEGDEEWKYRWLESKLGGGSYPHRLLHDRDTFMVGNISFQAVHTPGHTAEHISFLVTDVGGGVEQPMGIATGDFVFVGDIGRPDLLESAAGLAGVAEPSARQLYGSLHRFTDLPDYVQVWPGHGAGSACGKALGAIPQSTVGYEKRFNPSVAAASGDEERFVDTILSGQPEPPPYFARMKKENRDGPVILGGMPNPHLMDASIAALRAANDEETVVIDTRSWAEFREGHLPGALHAPLDRTFPTIAGSYIQPEQKIILIAEHDHLDEATAALVRIGLDEVEGYLPPSALTAFLATSDLKESVAEIGGDDFARLAMREKPFLLDVRRGVEYQAGHIEGALNIAHTRLATELRVLPKDKPIYVHCQMGGRSAAATAYLQRIGYDVINVKGGYARLSETGLAIVDGVMADHIEHS